MLSEPRNRALAVIASATDADPAARVNGVDFVAVTSPLTLVVHFLNDVPVTAPTAIITGGDSLTDLPLRPITPADWGTDPQGRPTLTLTTLLTGDFSPYTLTLHSPALDLVLNSAIFSFKATCPSEFDCLPPPCCCPPEDVPVPPIDYLARDFNSFQAALLGFSALRYPGWVERAEADFGMMLAELLAYVGDEFSYLQDRVAAEANIVTATQRRSLVSLARLVDYEPAPAVSGSTLLQCNAAAAGSIAAGLRVDAMAPDGTPVPFEIGTGVADAGQYPVNPLWNFGIAPYWFDDSAQCLPRGATSLWVQGHGFGFTTGQQLLIQTDLPGESRRQIVTLTQPGFEALDPVFPAGTTPAPITRLTWGAGDALAAARDLTCTRLGGNLLPATQGQRFSETFAIATAPGNQNLAIARRGPNGSDAAPNYVFRFPLAQPTLGWLGGAPELILTQTAPAAQSWRFATTLLAGLPTDNVFTIDPLAWQVIGRTPTGQPQHYDIAGQDGVCLRFGNNIFGACPAAGDVFEVHYRTGLGARGNVAADSITLLQSPSLLTAARNPFAVTNAADAEPAGHIARMAPQAFRAVQYRAVLAADYAAAAQTLPWVNKAGAAFRWTGSWMTIFTAADPQGGAAMSLAQQIELVDLLNRYRLAGYESYAPPPDYLSIDLRIEICVQPGWLAGDAAAGVRTALSGGCNRQGFFFADHFTFGTPLYRSRLQAAIQAVPGVLGVHAIRYRKRGAFTNFRPLPEILAPATGQILRVANDPSWPERGTITIIAEGGR